MKKNPNIKLSNLILGLSSALDLVNWFIVNHHRQVATLAVKIADGMGFPDEGKSNIAIASALHDIGAISFNEKFNFIFEAENMNKHAELGYLLLQNFKPFIHAAEFVRYHHVPWRHGRGAERGGRRVPRESHILHLADRVSVLLASDLPVLKQAESVRRTISAEKGRMFVPEIVEAFLQLSASESFWLEAAFPAPGIGIDGASTAWNIELDIPTLLDMSELFRMIIDFRSSLTATHSKDVAYLAQSIAARVGFSEQECTLLHIAGNLHDLGKLAVPVEMIEKEGPLSPDDLYIMRSHPYHTYRVLDRIGGLDDIALWASFHHECLDGTGYPFRHSGGGLPLASRIVAVADVLSALTERRSYRAAMSFPDALAILQDMARERKLDPAIVSLVEHNLDFIREVKVSANDEALQEFHKIRSDAATVDQVMQSAD